MMFSDETLKRKVQRHLQSPSLLLDTGISFANYMFSLYEGVGEAANV